MRPVLRPALVALLVSWQGLAAAGPDDEFKRAELAYARGDVVAAMAALRAPARAGHAPSQTFLAFILDRADFVDEAFALYRDAAAQGHAEGHAGLALAYQTGRGVAKDEKQALAHFSKAADAGHAPSIEQLAQAHLRGDLGLAGASQTDTLAPVRRAAERGHLMSVDALAQAYAVGRWGMDPDPAQAATWRMRAAELRAQRGARPAPTAGRR
jgi:TPR repeat protein